jgi:hypothetical protein
MIGTSLSHCRIKQKLGQGGMGEVYRAEDTVLGRQVAIKILPDIFAGDPERLARFEREARLLASLNHPNIASIYELEQSDGKRFLVLELVEGQTHRSGYMTSAGARSICSRMRGGATLPVGPRTACVCYSGQAGRAQITGCRGGLRTGALPRRNSYKPVACMYLGLERSHGRVKTRWSISLITMAQLVAHWITYSGDRDLQPEANPQNQFLYRAFRRHSRTDRLRPAQGQAQIAGPLSAFSVQSNCDGPTAK